MGSKMFLLLGLLFATVLLISSEAAARDLAEAASITPKDDVDITEGENGVENAKYGGGYPGGYGGRGGGGYGGRGGGGYGGRGGNGGRGGRGHGCRYGYCRYGCCRYAGETTDAKTEAQPHN